MKLSLTVLLFGLSLQFAPFAQADFTAPAKNLSNSALDSMYPKICFVPGGPVALAIWVETDGTNDCLYFSKSNDSGNSWSSPLPLTDWGQILGHSDAAEDNRAFSMEVAAPYVHIVIQGRPNSEDYELYYHRSSDLGDTWDEWVQVTNNSSASRCPDVAAQGEYVHIAYQDDWPGNTEIMYKRITNYGAGLVDQTRRLTFSGGISIFPKIAARESSGNVSIVYQDDTSGVSNVFYKNIADGGAGAYLTRQLTFGADWNGLADIAVGTGPYDEYVYIAYVGTWPGNADIMYKAISGGGSGTISTARLTYSATASLSPSIDWDTFYTDNVFVSYHDSWPGNNDAMYRYVTPAGVAFYGYRVSWGAGDSSHSTIAADSSWAYVAWMDNTSGNYEIYVKHGF